MTFSEEGLERSEGFVQSKKVQSPCSRSTSATGLLRRGVHVARCITAYETAHVFLQLGEKLGSLIMCTGLGLYDSV